MLRRVGFAIVLGVLLLSIAPSGSPVQLSYVYSDSMEPTIDVDDGYVLVPAGEVEPGDVVTFWSPQRDAYVTHRIVGRTDGGYVTKGDNNPTADQRAGYAPVPRERIVGTLLTIDGEPLLIPYLGTVVGFLKANRVPILTVLIGGVGLHWVRAADARPERDLERVRDVFRPVFLVALIAMVAFPVLGGTSHGVTLVAVDDSISAEAPGVVHVGTTERVEFIVRQPAQPLTYRLVSARGMTVTDRTRSAANVEIAGEVRTPPEPGPVRVHVSVNQYPAVLPRPVLAWLHDVHPLVAGSASGALVLAPFWLLYHATIDSRSPLRPSRSRLGRLLQGGLE